MNRILIAIVLVSLSGIVGLAAAVPMDNCTIPPGQFRTQTMGGWGQENCHGGNPACIRNQYFPSCFPNGLVIGGSYALTFTSSAAVAEYLPAGGSSSVLTESYTNPSGAPGGNFAGQLTALAVSLGFSRCGVPGFGDLGRLVILNGLSSQTGAFSGWTVDEIFELANQVLGGNLALLPAGITVSDLGTTLDHINSNFVDGTQSNGFLVYAECDIFLPVNVTAFEAFADGDDLALIWRTASETDVSFFEISRRADETEEWTVQAQVESRGNNPSGFTYRWNDHAVNPGQRYEYRLTVHDIDGSVTTYAGIASATVATASAAHEYALSQNFPNPFNPTTSISFDLVESGFLTLSIYNLMGQEIATLIRNIMPAGHHTISFDATDLPTGAYLYRIEANGFAATRKMLLLK